MHNQPRNLTNRLRPEFVKVKVSGRLERTVSGQKKPWSCDTTLPYLILRASVVLQSRAHADLLWGCKGSHSRRLPDEVLPSSSSLTYQGII